MTREPKRLGELLLDARLLTTSQLELALRHQRAFGGRLGEVLEQLRLVDSERVRRALARQRGVPFVELERLPLQREIVELLPAAARRRLQALPIAVTRTFRGDVELQVALANPWDMATLDTLWTLTRMRVRPVLAAPEAIARMSAAFEMVQVQRYAASAR